ncbi:hypothetical protein [Bdellovibrio sp. BCCA]|uniref:hypothetical protein n=1 Tax=Bdellovibrio sp. BCCA TaxID=3136281 RepID=UPI0030F297C8
MNRLVKLDHKTIVSLQEVVAVMCATLSLSNRRTLLSMKTGSPIVLDASYREVLQLCIANGMTHLSPVSDSISVDKDQIVSIVDCGEYCQLSFTNGAKFEVRADLNAVSMSLDGVVNSESLIIGAPSSSVMQTTSGDPQ